jgi:Zn-dependent M16 (insulinase) family peptidase
VQHHSCIIAVPDEEMADVIAEQEENRIEEQRERLGDDGLSECEKTLKSAIEENTVIRWEIMGC